MLLPHGHELGTRLIPRRRRPLAGEYNCARFEGRFEAPFYRLSKGMVESRKLPLLTFLALSAGAYSPGGESSPPFESPPSVYRPDLATPEGQTLLSARHPGWRRFLDEHPGRWRAVWNEAAGTPHRISGDEFVISKEAVGPDAAARSILAAWPELFPVREESLHLETVKDLGPFTLVRFRQTFDGLPIIGSRAEVWLTPAGALVRRAILLGSDLIPESALDALSSAPLLGLREGAELAVSASRRRTESPGGFIARESSLAIAPLHVDGRLAPRLVWEIRGPGADGRSLWVYLVAADPEPLGAAGEILGAWDEAARGSVSGAVTGRTSPGLFPDVPWNPPELRSLPNLRVLAGPRSAVTDTGGSFVLEFDGAGPVTLTASLEGPFAKVFDGQSPGLKLTAAGVESGSLVPFEFNAAPEAAATAQVNAFIAVNAAHHFVKSLDPSFTGVDRPIIVRTNLEDECGAFFLPGADGLLGFSRASPGCVNSSYSTVVFHEYGHFVAWQAFGAVPPHLGYNEGAADAFCALLTDQPMIGQSFNGEEGAAGGFIRNLAGPPLLYPQDLLQEAHYAGLIFGGAVWDLRARLAASLGSAAGLDRVRRLYMKSLFLAPRMISPDLVEDFLTLDDDDGVLANGTPNDAEIIAAFGSRGLRPPGELSIEHATQADSASLGPFTIRARVASTFDSIQPIEAVLHHSRDGGVRFTEVPMTLGGDGSFEAAIPEQLPATTVRYFIEARGAGGVRAVFPPGAPEDETIVFAVGESRVVFSDGFDGVNAGWTHGLAQGGGPVNIDDWERGAPRDGRGSPFLSIDANLVDAPAAFSPPNCWGNGLGLPPRNERGYSDRSSNFLLSPPIDCTGRRGIHLRLRRWLTAERSDRAKIFVGDALVYESPSHRDILDTGWRAIDIDIARLADGRAGVRIRFELTTNASVTAGGWTIDDVVLISTGVPPVERPELTALVSSIAFKGGGGPFELRGSGFTTAEDTRLTFASVPATDFQIDSPGLITGRLPAAVAGPVLVALENSGGAASLSNALTYYDLPVLTQIVPEKSPLAGGENVTIFGNYFTEGDVFIGGKSAGPVDPLSSEILVGSIPPGDDIGAVDVVIRSEFGESRFPRAFTYVEEPVLTAVEPSRGPVGGGTSFTLRGRFFPSDAGGVRVEFGGRQALFSVRRRTEIAGVLPAGEGAGPVEVKVATPGGTATLPGGFEYIEGPAPAFLRGDVDLDGSRQITDPIALLDYLFLGGLEPSCHDAADATDDGALDLADAVAILAYLFTGGSPLPPPLAAAGPDPTPDALSCDRGA